VRRHGGTLDFLSNYTSAMALLTDAAVHSPSAVAIKAILHPTLGLRPVLDQGICHALIGNLGCFPCSLRCPHHTTPPCRYPLHSAQSPLPRVVEQAFYKQPCRLEHYYEKQAPQSYTDDINYFVHCPPTWDHRCYTPLRHDIHAGDWSELTGVLSAASYRAEKNRALKVSLRPQVRGYQWVQSLIPLSVLVPTNFMSRRAGHTEEHWPSSSRLRRFQIKSSEDTSNFHSRLPR
jgi:hypothetical protein